MREKYSSPAEYWDACQSHDWKYQDTADPNEYDNQHALRRHLRAYASFQGQDAVDIYQSFHTASLSPALSDYHQHTRPNDTELWMPRVKEKRCFLE